MLLGKNELEKLFRDSIDSDSSINRKKKRELKKKVERPLMFFLQYLFGDPTISGEDLDLKGERFIYTPSNAKDREAFHTFEKAWKKFLIAEGFLASVEAEDTCKLSEDGIEEKIISVASQATEIKEKVGVTSHSQYKLLCMDDLMKQLGIGAREIGETDYRSETTREQQLAIENLGRRIYGESELIKVGNSNGRAEMFRYFYHWGYNLITILPEDEESIVTIYKAYIDSSMAEEILLENKRNKKTHSATLRETQISYRRINDLLEYRKRQLDMLERQRKALLSSIGIIEESFIQNDKDISRIINEKKYLA